MDLLCSALVRVKETILIYCRFQKPGMNQVHPLHGHVQGGSRQRCSLRNPAVIWESQDPRLYDSRYVPTARQTTNETAGGIERTWFFFLLGLPAVNVFIFCSMMWLAKLSIKRTNLGPPGERNKDATTLDPTFAVSSYTQLKRTFDCCYIYNKRQ